MAAVKKILNFFGRNAKPDESTQSKVHRQLIFQPSKPLTIGVECEFGIVDAGSYKPTPAALEIVGVLNNAAIHHELHQHIIEITSDVCSSVLQVKKDLEDRLGSIRACLPEYNSVLVAAGTLPFLTADQLIPVKNERYDIIRSRRKSLYDKFSSMGMHIHIGMSDASSCIRFHNFYMHLLPHLLALSANSPFEKGIDTGLHSVRATVTESMPIGGLPYQFKNWQDYKDLCTAMVKADSIVNLKDLWWDLRPCPNYGTLEIRICDQPATMAEVAAIVAFVHCLGHWFAEHENWLEEVPRPNNWRMRENKWRAIRYGLGASLVINDDGDLRPVKEDILLWIERLNPFYEKMGYHSHRDMLLQMVEKGNGAIRQKRLWKVTQSFEAIYAHLIKELKHGSPLWDSIEILEKEKEQESPQIEMVLKEEAAKMAAGIYPY